MRIGFGYDVHALALGRSLALGGIIIPYKYGLEGHSDADVMIHALMDSLLGAAALRDIGYHFDDADKRYKDIDSKILLKHVLSLIEKAGYRFVNCDITLVAQRPKIAPYIISIFFCTASGNPLRIALSAPGSGLLISYSFYPMWMPHIMLLKPL